MTCEENIVSLRGSILESRKQLSLIRDITILPKINSMKVKRAIKSYVPGKSIGSESVLLLIDNTLLRSAKQGLIVTTKMLYSFSNISGKFSIPLVEIEVLSPQVRMAIGNRQLGMVVNGDNFISLPGMTEGSQLIQNFVEMEGVLVQEDLSPAILYFSVFLSKALGCELLLDKEEDPGPPPWYNEG